MTDLQAMNTRQVDSTRIRLLVSRAFGLGILAVLMLGTSYWSRFLDDALFFAGSLLAIAGFCGRLWCHSYIAGRKKKLLITVGPYSLCRHPLYFFSLVGGIGLALCTETLSAPILFMLAFALYYPHVIRTEEAFLSTTFPGYEEYRKRVPLFFPSWSNFTDDQTVALSGDFRREIIAAGGFLCCIGFFEFVEALHQAEILPTLFFIP